MTLIFSESETEHVEHVKLVFERLKKYGLNINQSKSLYGQHTIEFLGHEISETGIKPLGRKVKVILEYPRPENLCELRKYLGLINFY